MSSEQWVKDFEKLPNFDSFNIFSTFFSGLVLVDAWKNYRYVQCTLHTELTLKIIHCALWKHCSCLGTYALHCLYYSFPSFYSANENLLFFLCEISLFCLSLSNENGYKKQAILFLVYFISSVFFFLFVLPKYEFNHILSSVNCIGINISTLKLFFVAQQ